MIAGLPFRGLPFTYGAAAGGWIYTTILIIAYVHMLSSNSLATIMIINPFYIPVAIDEINNWRE